MLRRLQQALVIALVLWSWYPVASAGFILARPTQLVLGGDATIQIDRHGEYDSRISGGRNSDFKIGDHFSAASLSFADRLTLYGYQAARAADAVAVRVLRDGVGQTIVVRPRSIDLLRSTVGGPLDVALYLVTTLLSAVAVTCAGTLALRRPGVLTTSLLLALFGGLINEVSAWPFVTGFAGFLIIWLGYGFWWFCSWQFVHFATRFPDGQAGTRARPLLLIAGLIALAAGALGMLRYCAGLFYPIAAVPNFLVSDGLDSPARTFYVVANAALPLLAVVAMVLRYRAAPEVDRLKLRSVVLAIAVIFFYTTFNWLSFLIIPYHLGKTPVDELLAWCGLVIFLVPVTIFAAILRHRLLGISFVFDRALVYGGLALVLVAPLRLINVFLSARFPHTRVALYGEVAVALALALTIDPLRRFMELALRRTLFRAHEHGLQQLDALIRAADDIVDEAALERLVAASADALVLTSASLAPTVLDPSLVVPLHCGRRAAGHISFGAHRNGADLDPEEVRALEKFSASIERAIERLALERLETEVASLRERLGEGEHVPMQLPHGGHARAEG